METGITVIISEKMNFKAKSVMREKRKSSFVIIKAQIMRTLRGQEEGWLKGSMAKNMEGLELLQKAQSLLVSLPPATRYIFHSLISFT